VCVCVDENLKDFPVELTYMSQLRPRVRAAVELQHVSCVGARKKSSQSWLTKAAKELDIMLDEEEDQQPSLYPLPPQKLMHYAGQEGGRYARWSGAG